MHDGKAKDVYTWHVTYRDGSQIHEFDRPEGRGFVEVGEKPVRVVEITPVEVGEDFAPELLAGRRPYRMPIPDGATPIFFRRRSIIIHIESDQMHMQSAIHCIGWKLGEKARYLFIRPDHTTVLTDDLQAV